MNATTMQTYTGKLVDLANFTEEDVRLRDITHSLSMINRFTGHTTVPYTVAQHSVVVSKLVPPEDSMWGLLHDASEAYLGDIATPLKSFLPDYMQLERHVQRTIAKKFGLKWPMPESVKVADRRALIHEKTKLLSVQHDWGITAEPICASIVLMDWRQAEELFANRYKELAR